MFRPEDLRLVESVQKGLKSRGYRGQGASWPTVAVVAFPNMVSPISIICWRRCLRTNDIGGIFRTLGAILMEYSNVRLSNV